MLLSAFLTTCDSRLVWNTHGYPKRYWNMLQPPTRSTSYSNKVFVFRRVSYQLSVQRCQKCQILHIVSHYIKQEPLINPYLEIIIQIKTKPQSWNLSHSSKQTHTYARTHIWFLHNFHALAMKLLVISNCIDYTTETELSPLLFLLKRPWKCFYLYLMIVLKKGTHYLEMYLFRRGQNVLLCLPGWKWMYPVVLKCIYKKHYENMPYSNILKFLPPKIETFSDKKKLIFFNISAQNIDCGYSLEPPLWFWAEIRTIMYTPVNPSFTYVLYKSGV